MQHRTRDVLIRQRTQIINALRAHLAELGIVAAQGDKGVKELLAIVADKEDTRLPIDARASVIVLAAQLEAVQTLIGSIEKRIKMQHRSNEASQRVETIPGIGVLGASAITATAVDPTVIGSHPSAMKRGHGRVQFGGALHGQSSAICLSDGRLGRCRARIQRLCGSRVRPLRDVSLGENVYERIPVPPWAGKDRG
jgi:transposase